MLVFRRPVYFQEEPTLSEDFKIRGKSIACAELGKQKSPPRRRERGDSAEDRNWSTTISCFGLKLLLAP